MKSAVLIFPHQLFRDHPGLTEDPAEVHLIEDSLFFGDRRYPRRFHQQKLWLHHASMKRWAKSLEQKHPRVEYVDYAADNDPLERSLKNVVGRGVRRVVIADPCDFLLKKRLRRATERFGLDLQMVESPGFLNSCSINDRYRDENGRWAMAEFYKFQRRRLEILVDRDEPVGGKWSFDQDNRKKVPKSLLGSLPKIPTVDHDTIDEAARDHIRGSFPNNPGRLDRLIFPTSHDDADDWLRDFLRHRLERFGDYEDAIEEGESWLWHGVLTPLLNVGLLTPAEVVEATLDHADRHEVPLNSLEGFLRQVIGWREFMRATYVDLGVTMRTTNHWGHRRKIPSCFYDASTGIDPIDDVIRRVLDTGYCHHIERLMVLGGFMFLCEFDPDEIYRWFMELFVDAYDWVMVPNVYAMSQHADGGLITTKPYFSGSAYIKKMSHYRHGPWADTWDGLYWRWIGNHRDELRKNPRWAMMCATESRMDDQKRKTHQRNAEAFLKRMDDMS